MWFTKTIQHCCTLFDGTRLFGINKNACLVFDRTFVHIGQRKSNQVPHSKLVLDSNLLERYRMEHCVLCLESPFLALIYPQIWTITRKSNLVLAVNRHVVESLCQMFLVSFYICLESRPSTSSSRFRDD